MRRAVILTALELEYNAVRAHLSNPKEESHRGTIYDRGTFPANQPTWEIWIGEVGIGNNKASAAAERAISRFQPEVIFFVGVAGGIQDVQLGDVVASTKIYGYESGKAGKTFRPRPEVFIANHGLEQRARAERRSENWQKRIISPIDTLPRAFVSPIAAGAQVIDSTKAQVYKFLRANYSDAIAVEMEGLGFLEAAHINQEVAAIVIRGISDMVDDKQTTDANGYQPIAARHASAFAFEMLANLNPEDSTKSSADSKINPVPAQSHTESAAPKVFISYSHDSEPHKSFVLSLANQLCQDGIDCTIDVYEPAPSVGWPRWMREQIKKSEFVLIVCTEQYQRRFLGQEEEGVGAGVAWEGCIITEELYRAQGINDKFIPVIGQLTDQKFIPTPLPNFTRYALDQPAGYEELLRRLTKSPATPKPNLGALKEMPPAEQKYLFKD
jgi:nucleoside phosphorylase